MQTRRNFLRAIGSCGLLSMTSLLSDAQSKTHRSPNIIIIMADDLGYGDLSCYGNQNINTPNLDALAAGGVKFTDYHSSGPVCSPTRAGLLTGRYQQRCGIPGVLTVAQHRDQGLSPDEITFSRVFKDSGYKTAIFGKWHLGYKPEFNPRNHGFDQFQGYLSGNVDYISHIDQAGVYDWWNNQQQIEEEGYSTHLITKHALRFIDENKEKPFCLYIAHEAPHYPYQAPDDPADRTVGGEFPNHGSRKDIKGAYKSMVEEMDKGIGQVMKKVRQLGLEQDTFIFFCSDNGANKAGSNGSLRGYKSSLWEGGHRVPAIAYWSGIIAPGGISKEPVISLDVFPTILSAARLKKPASCQFDGTDLMPHLLLGSKIPERSLFWSFKKQKAIRRGGWKLIETEKNNQKIIELFNLKKDLSEKNNLANSNKDKLQSLTKEMHRYSNELCKF